MNSTDKVGISTILIVVIVAALVCVSVSGYILISRPPEEEISPPGVTADEATQILLNNIIKTDELNHDLIAFMWPELLNLGDTIAPHGLMGNTYVMEDNTWFFWVDDFPFAMFSHPTRYVFIDALTGDYTVEIEDWWPQLNGSDLWGTTEEFWDNEYWIYSTYVGNLNGSRSFRLADLRGASSSPGRNRALIIEGDSIMNDISTSAGEWHYLMENVFGFDVTHPSPLGPLENEKRPTENNLDNIMDNLSKELKPCENFSIYITGHGRENDGAVEMVDGFMLTPEQFSEWVCRIENGVHITVTVAACYSGKWIPALKKWDNKVEVIYTSTDENSVGWGDVDHKHTTFAKYREAVENGDASPDPNDDDVGLEAVSGLVEDMEALAENFKRGDISWVKLWQEAIKTAKEKDAAYQNKEFFKRWTEQNRPDLYPPCSGKGVQDPQEWKSDKVRDNVSPEVISTSPENGQDSVPVDTAVTVTFSERMNRTVTQNAFSILPTADGEFSWVDNTMIFTSLEDLLPGTPYEVTISTGATDRALNHLEEDYAWTFLIIGVPQEVRSLSISADSPVPAGGSSSITVFAYDAGGDPVSGADISLRWSIPNSKDPWEQSIALTDQGDGTYTGSLTLQRAGVYSLTASAKDGTITASGEVIFKPGDVADVKISSTSPRPASPWYTSILTFYFVDQYGNLVPGEEVDLQVESTFGDVGESSPLHGNPDDTFSISLDAVEWGTAEVIISDGNTGVSASKQVEFTPTYVDLSYDLVEPTVEFTSLENLDFFSSGDNQSFSLNIGIFFPPENGTLGGYDLRVEYDNSLLELVDITDPDLTDNFEAPEPWISDNVIYLTQFGSTTEPGVSIATIQFKPWEWVENLWESLEKKASKIITWAENLWNDLLVPVEVPPGMVVENGKVFKKLFIPLKIWIVDNVRDEENVRKIAEITENIYNMNAKRCRFKYWFVYLVEINHISQSEWDNKVPTGHVEGDDSSDPWYPEPNADNQRNKLISQNKWERWVNVYWLPDNAFGEFGWYKDNVILIDNANEGRDNHITLAHELAHLLSGGKVEDPTTATGKSQGADNYCNLMAYDFNKSHGNLTENQAKLIEEWIDGHSEERPEAEGGGRILKPIPY